MSAVFTNASVLTPTGFRSDVTVKTRAGRIEAVDDAAADTRAVEINCEGGLLVPGYVDIQVNGGGGVLFNDRPDIEGLKAIAAAHLKSGTTALMPTLISDDLSVVDAGMRAVEAAREAGMAHILGIHVEGPFLNPAKRGIHDADKFLTLDDAAIELLCSLKSGCTLVTLAPETCTPDQVRTLVERGVIVSLGHTNGKYAHARAALEAGATGFTHLFNAMPQMHSREPGVVGAALESQTAWTSLIVDGRHVDPVMLKLAHRLRPAGKLILITDAMPNAGTELTHFVLQGRKIHVSDGECRDEKGVLAGAHLTMDKAVTNAIALMQLDIAEAVAMAGANPARFLGLASEIGVIAPGARADLLQLDRQGRLVAVHPASASPQAAPAGLRHAL